MREELKNSMNDWMNELANDSPIHEGHESRFEQRLQGSLERRNTWRKDIRWWAALVVIALAVTAFFGVQKIKQEVAITDDEEALPMEVQRVADFYSNNASKLTSYGLEDENVKELKGQLAYLNQEFERLSKLYQEQQNNENIIRGMIDNFEVRLRIIQQLNKYLEIQKNKESHDQKNA
jgi:multidrug efflux pump subunit AcrB